MLRLAGDDVLTIDDLLDGRLTDCRLAVASACQSGHYATADAPDEFTGLSAGFLQAGAACAVVSLWQVRDDVTSLLMARFYELMLQVGSEEHESPVTSLRETRKWIRQLSADQVGAFKSAHPQLSPPPGSSSVGDHEALDQGTNPYSSPEYWAAFVAWGY
jgi:CHAT domain-containing protein